MSIKQRVADLLGLSVEEIEQAPAPERRVVASDAVTSRRIRRAYNEAKAEAPGFRRARPAAKHRAGTVLDHRHVRPIFATVKREGGSEHGLLDMAQRVYQCGGEWRKFVYHKENLVSIPLPVFNEIRYAAAWLEVIDHEKQECWRIAMDDARHLGTVYNAGLGERFGVHVDHWTVLDRDGHVVREPTR